ncbi:hypothetical protein [Saccharopolyspora pogona]|uniref:hypothetical protein n=1 Tax=Saccharopolyspora pogona TaxID=333966 RepID=UPI00168806D3|nr:hypothetical protein [Saccharopolyspora pogona]
MGSALAVSDGGELVAAITAYSEVTLWRWRGAGYEELARIDNGDGRTRSTTWRWIRPAHESPSPNKADVSWWPRSTPHNSVECTLWQTVGHKKAT